MRRMRTYAERMAAAEDPFLQEQYMQEVEQRLAQKIRDEYQQFALNYGQRLLQAQKQQMQDDDVQQNGAFFRVPDAELVDTDAAKQMLVDSYDLYYMHNGEPRPVRNIRYHWPTFTAQIYGFLPPMRNQVQLGTEQQNDILDENERNTM